MALITISGFPCSGKSTRALQLQQDFLARLSSPEYTGPKLRVIIVDDESNHVPRSVYDSSISEKSGRANIYSAVTRNLGTDTIVICDSPNYIKGFRYQMYCAAREAHARVCTLHIATPPEVCREWHEKRGECSYKPETFDNLIMRFEEPSSMVRWDSPLFTIPYIDPLPLDAIWATITTGAKAPPTAAVLAPPKPPPNTLQILTSTTSAITTALLAHVNATPGSSGFVVPSPPARQAGELRVRLPMKRVTLSEMQRLKRHRAAGVGGADEVAVKFVGFLEATWDTAGD
ncbi:chromatin associated protein KTI12 [Dioszegia hungarica]|uniref:Chromatin associated protein KTI12 n=1 Tax=Dioszegia hungarica TaxID=4972 RepID=A0AA38HB39_9TREE|nr:chromatin associated protein KTI12 [Dioszegia hungarica]KAI9635936.1 chromatin associated protein KTI12 [Dioszegia hungarica]